jgi:hypothetical protein
MEKVYKTDGEGAVAGSKVVGAKVVCPMVGVKLVGHRW